LIFESLFHEFVDLIRDLFLLIEKYLFFVILPIESQIKHAYGLPVIRELRACSVDDSGDLIGDHKL